MADTKSASYLGACLDRDRRNKTVARCVRHLKPIAHTFDAVAITGVSGLIGAAVADRLKKGIIVVRKGEQRHSSHRVEGSLAERYIFIDDQIDTGQSIKRVLNNIRTHHNPKAQCVGIYLWWTGVAEGENMHHVMEWANPTNIPIIVNALESKHMNTEINSFHKWL